MCSTNNDIRHFETFLRHYIVPLLLNCSLHGPEKCNSVFRDSDVCFDSLSRLKVYLPGSQDIHFTLRRTADFSYDEKDFLEHIIRNTRQNPGSFTSPEDNFFTECIEKAIAFRLSPEYAGNVYRLLRRYAQWTSDPCHEHTLGVCLNRNKAVAWNIFSSTPQAWRNLGSGHGSLLAVNGDGGIIGIQNLTSRQYTQRMEQEVRAPVQMSDIALWTARGEKLAFRLTTDGDIFLFKSKQLAFAKRRSHWMAFPHQSIIEWCFSSDVNASMKDIGTDVYLTALDVSLSGREASIHIVGDGRRYLADTQAPLAELTGGKKFAEIPRKSRLPICYLEDSLTLDQTGILLGSQTTKKSNNKSQESAGTLSLDPSAISVRICKGGYVEISKSGSAAIRFA